MSSEDFTSQEWKKRFVNLDERFLHDLSLIWPIIVNSMLDDAHEDEITVKLVDHFLQEYSSRRYFHAMAYQFAPFGKNAKGEPHIKGYIDFALLLDRSRILYLAYECKRLNVAFRGGVESLAGKYVNDGVMRYVSEQYSENIPFGCMLGYVMDGNIEFAKEKVGKAIRSVRNPTAALENGPTDLASVGSFIRFATLHKRSGGKRIEIRHAMLPFRNISKSSG